MNRHQLLSLWAAAALITIAAALPSPANGPALAARYPPGHPYYQEPHIRINSIADLEPKYAQRAMKDVTQTISEVQKILATNPHLPRLTRGEIEELFENVTREEFEKSMRNGDRSRAKHMRALMVVLPYNTNNYSADALQDLYTRPPVTRVLSDAAQDAANRVVRPQQVVVSPASPATAQLDNPLATTYKPQLNNRQSPVASPTPTTFRPPGKFANIFTRLPTYSAPAKFLQQHQQQQQQPSTARPAQVPIPTTTSTTTSTTTTTTTTTTPKPAALYSSHFNAHNPPFAPHLQPPMRHNVKDLLATIGLTAEVTTQRPPTPQLTAEMRELLRSFGLLTNEQPPLHFNFDSSSPNPSTAADPFHFGEDLSAGHGAQEEFLPIAPAYNYQLDDTFHVNLPEVTHSFPAASPELTADFLLQPTAVTKNYRMHDAPDPVANDYYAFKPLPLADSEIGGEQHLQAPATLNADMEAFLRSYGLLDTGNRNKKSIGQKTSTTAEPSTTTTTTSTTTTTTTTTTTPRPTRPAQRMDKIPAVEVDFLSPQLLNVLGNLGITNNGASSRVIEPTVIATRRSDQVLDEAAVYSLETTKETKTSGPTQMYPVFRPDAAEIVTESKTISTTSETRTQTPRRSEPLPISTTSETKPATSRRPATTKRSSSTISSPASSNIMIVLPTSTHQTASSTFNSAANSHVSIVKSVSVASDNRKPELSLDEAASDYAKLQFLLATVRKLEKQNGTLSDADLDLLDVNKLNLSETLMKYTKQQMASGSSKGSLDPVRLAELSAEVAQIAKNEVKRQSAEVSTTEAAEKPFRFTLDLAVTTEESKASEKLTDPVDEDSETAVKSASTTSATSAPKTTTTTPSPLLSKEVERPNGLEDSFPGGLDPVTEEPLPPPRRNGFYFFADWNSFLEVGEDPDKVVVRFDPKIGDSSRFIPVNP